MNSTIRRQDLRSAWHECADAKTVRSLVGRGLESHGHFLLTSHGVRGIEYCTSKKWPDRCMGGAAQSSVPRAGLNKISKVRWPDPRVIGHHIVREDGSTEGRKRKTLRATATGPSESVRGWVFALR